MRQAPHTTMTKSTSYLVLNTILRFLCDRLSSFLCLASGSSAILLFTGAVFSIIRTRGSAEVVDVERADCGRSLAEQGALPVVGLSLSLMRGRLDSSWRTHAGDACGGSEASPRTSSSTIAGAMSGMDADSPL